MGKSTFGKRCPDCKEALIPKSKKRCDLCQLKRDFPAIYSGHETLEDIRREATETRPFDEILEEVGLRPIHKKVKSDG